jgi:nucleotide-binding universal stress UspA family protein
MAAAVAERTRPIFVCNPDNPAGTRGPATAVPVDGGNEMRDLVGEPIKVLLGVSTGRSAVAALRLAAEWHKHSEFELHVLHVLPNRGPMGSVEPVEPSTRERAELMRHRAEAWLSDTLLTWHYRTATGHPGAELVAEARRIGAALVLLGSAGMVADYVRAGSRGTPTIVAAGPDAPRHLDPSAASVLDAALAGGPTPHILTIGSDSL